MKVMLMILVIPFYLFGNIKNDVIYIYNLKNNKTIYSNNVTKKVSPASLTKVMTVIMALESKKLNDVVTITKEMINVEPTIVGLKVGEQYKIIDLIHAAMIKSGNDAAFAIGYYLGKGNIKNFVEQMNKKANKIGMKNTKFTNPAGLDIGNNYSTAEDLLKLSKYSIKNNLFNSIAQKEKYKIYELKTKKQITLVNSNKLLKENKNFVGIKTGYTKKAGPCLITRIKEKEKDVLVIILNNSNRWDIAKTILNKMKNT